MSRLAITAQAPETPFDTTGLCSFPHCPPIEHFRREKDCLIQEQQRLQEEIEAQKAVLAKLKDMLFGRSSEKTPRAKQTQKEAQTGTNCETENGSALKTASENASESGCETGAGKDGKSTKPGGRGGQPGHQGFGRAIPNLPVEEVFYEIPPEEKCCPHCGEPMKDIHLTEESRTVDYEVSIKVIKHIRKRAVRKCSCAGPKTITAPKPPKVIPKGLFSNSFLAHLLVTRFLFQIPTQRLASMLKIQGLDVSAGTLFGLYKQLVPVFAPLYALLVEVSRQAKLWQVDETRWMNFIRIPGKDSHYWWLWVFITPRFPQTVLYVLDPLRSSKISLAYFKPGTRGVFLGDRFSAHVKLAKVREGLIQAFCWAHFRRDFINAGKHLTCLEPWAGAWVARIADIYRLNEARLAADDPECFLQAQMDLEQALDEMVRAREAEWQQPDLHWTQRKVLESARTYWGGLTVFVNHPRVPMDNNLAERMLRPVALGRKNSNGTFSEWGGRFMAMCMSILRTAVEHGMDAGAYLRCYLDACAENGGPPADLERFLPWNVPKEALEKYALHRGNGL